jgi:hypothetical protein
LINSKQTITSSKTICNEKKTLWMQITFHCKPRFGFVGAPTKSPWNLDLYLVVDYKHMKAIDGDYNVRVGYWASRNNLQEYKVYVTIKWRGGHHHMSKTAGKHTNEECRQDYKYPNFHKNLRMYEQKHMTLLI